jgi:predicted RNA binding protein YcfA (HicA-like mRNA interferase family)
VTKKATKVEVIRACKKLGFEEVSSRRGDHFKYVFFYKGKRVLRVIIPKGRGELRPGTLEGIREDLRLNKESFKQAIECPLGRKAYLGIVEQVMQTSHI